MGIMTTEDERILWREYIVLNKVVIAGVPIYPFPSADLT